MKRIKQWIPLLAAMIILLAGCNNSVQPAAPEASPLPAPTGAPSPEPTAPAPAATLCFGDMTSHPALMELDESGRFHPYKRATRLDICQALYRLVDGFETTSASFSDLKWWQDGYRACSALFLTDILPVEDGAANPNEGLKRTELCQMLEHLANCLARNEAERTLALAEEVSAGSLAKNGTTDTYISRAELAVVVGRLAGYEPDGLALFLNECLPEDMTRNSFGWEYASDVVTEGLLPEVTPGMYRVKGWLYGVDESGNLLTDTDYGVWTFGLDSRYTTGIAELDACLAEALEESGANEAEGEAALEAVYLYVKNNFEYLVRPEYMDTIPVGTTGWEYERALAFFRDGGGTCYGYAAALGLLARALGEHAYVVAAEINQYYGPHGFVVIPEDGTDWIYDVEMEATRPERHDDLELFRIKNKAVYNYWYIPDW